MPRKNAKKTNLNERISIRCTKGVKGNFTRRMKKGGYNTQGELIEDALKALDDKEKIEKKNTHVCCIVQDIFNHLNITVDQSNGICFNEPVDEYLEGKVKELWGLM